MRTGSGIVIAADGLVLAIGYLIAEAQTVWLTASDGRVIHALKASVIAKREFAGYWEYVLDEAVFRRRLRDRPRGRAPPRPPIPEWGGTALVARDGSLLGVGSLLVEESLGAQRVQGNMMVPIDLLPPILADADRRSR